MGNLPFDPNSALGNLLGDMNTDDGQQRAIAAAERLVAADRTRSAQIDGLRQIFESETDTRNKAEAAVAFANTIMTAQVRFMGALRDAAVDFIADSTGKTRKEIEDAVVAARFEADPSALIDKLLDSEEFRTFLMGELNGDMAQLGLKTRRDGVLGISRIKDGEVGEPELFFSPTGEFLSHEEPGRLDAPAIGDAKIDGIDLSATFDPDENGARHLRDFDGGFGDDLR